MENNIENETTKKSPFPKSIILARSSLQIKFRQRKARMDTNPDKGNQEKKLNWPLVVIQSTARR